MTLSMRMERYPTLSKTFTERVLHLPPSLTSLFLIIPLRAYFVLDEVFLGGVLLETSANVMEKKLQAQERMMEAAKAGLVD